MFLVWDDWQSSVLSSSEAKWLTHVAEVIVSTKQMVLVSFEKISLPQHASKILWEHVNKIVKSTFTCLHIGCQLVGMLMRSIIRISPKLHFKVKDHQSHTLYHMLGINFDTFSVSNICILLNSISSCTKLGNLSCLEQTLQITVLPLLKLVTWLC